MAYNTAEPRAEYSANAGQTEFDFVFKIFSISDLKVYSTPFGQAANDETDILIENIDYTISINGDNGGTVTLTNPAGIDDVIVLLRDLPVKRDYEYQQGGDLSSDILNDDQDYQTYLLADKQRDSNRFLKLPDTSIIASNILPPIVTDAYFKWNADGTEIEYDTSIPDAAILSTDAALIAESYSTEPENVFVKTYNNGVGTQTTDYSALHWAAKSEGFAGNSDDSAVESQSSRWLSDAAKLTAQSYATEPEDVFVKTYSSDGDGTFTTTNTTDYSSLHWAAKSQASSEASAGDVSFDNTGTESVSNNVQDALVEIFEALPDTGTIAIRGNINTASIILKTIATGTATFTNSTNNINLTGIGIGVEIGDVIQITGSTNNNGDFTVEVITDNNNIIVNQAHAGKSRTVAPAGEKALINETATIVVTLLSKYYNASDTLGQGWVNVTATRTTGITYPNNTKRPIKVLINKSTTANLAFTINDIVFGTDSINNTYGEISIPSQKTNSTNATYSFVGTNTAGVMELR